MGHAKEETTQTASSKGISLPVPGGTRLDSWKEIAAYLNRNVRTVQRWEKCEGLPVHRHFHQKGSSVCASREEIDAWLKLRRLGPGEPVLLCKPEEPLIQRLGQKLLRVNGAVATEDCHSPKLRTAECSSM